MNVVITGASNGVGRACTDALRAEGAYVIGVDVLADSTADEHLTIDLSTPECGAHVRDHVGDRPLNALVNSAATVDYTFALETEVEAWDRMLSVNLRAPFLLAKALHPNLRSAGGSIVNISSVHAIATSPSVVAYAASKGGMVAMTRSLAIEWAPEVRVNGVLPGAIDTEMLATGLSRSGISLQELGMRHPMRRVGTPHDVAEAVLYLMRADFVTGTTVTVDGGATARLSTE